MAKAVFGGGCFWCEELKEKGINAVTEIKLLEIFYTEKEYHQNYFYKNPDNPYCAYVIASKPEKFFKNEIF